MRAFQAPKGSYTLKLNHRSIINDFFDIVLEVFDTDTRTDLMRLLDKYEKLPKDAFEHELKKIGLRDAEPIHKFMSVKNLHQLKTHFIRLADNDRFRNFEILIQQLEELGYK